MGIQIKIGSKQGSIEFKLFKKNQLILMMLGLRIKIATKQERIKTYDLILTNTLQMNYLHRKSKKRWVRENKENDEAHEASADTFELEKNTAHSRKLKTEPNDNRRLINLRQTLRIPYDLSNHRPFLENKKIVFTRGLRKWQDSIKVDGKHKKSNDQTNIDKLKREIQELDKEDFISFRSRTNIYMDDAKIIQNARISKYNHENSLIVQLKGQTCLYKPTLTRPKTTISGSGKGSRNSATHSMPHKYFSKPKKKAIKENNSSQNKQSSGQQLINIAKLKLKSEEIFIGLNNVLRGHVKHKKHHSQFGFV